MKKVTLGIFALLLVIGGVMASLIQRGISLRVATLIKPSEFHSSAQVAQALAARLFPELQSKKWLVYSFRENTSTTEPSHARDLLTDLLKEVAKTPAGEYQVKVLQENCEKHCVFLSNTSETEKQTEDFFSKSLQEEGAPVFRLQVSEFSAQETFPKQCESMQRLNEECIRAISIRDSLRKMTDPTKRYFFVKKYNHNFYYLFIEKK